MFIFVKTAIAKNFEELSSITASQAVFAHYAKDMNVKPTFQSRVSDNKTKSENSVSKQNNVEVAVIHGTDDLLQMNSQILDSPITTTLSQPSADDLSEIFLQVNIKENQPKPQPKKYKVLCAFDVDGYCAINNMEVSDEFLSVSKNEIVLSDGVIVDDWVIVKNEIGKIGKVPAKYIRIINEQCMANF